MGAEGENRQIKQDPRENPGRILLQTENPNNVKDCIYGRYHSHCKPHADATLASAQRSRDDANPDHKGVDLDKIPRKNSLFSERYPFLVPLEKSPQINLLF